jgi:hypothetical protein
MPVGDTWTRPQCGSDDGETDSNTSSFSPTTTHTVDPFCRLPMEAL